MGINCLARGAKSSEQFCKAIKLAWQENFRVNITSRASLLKISVGSPPSSHAFIHQKTLPVVTGPSRLEDHVTDCTSTRWPAFGNRHPGHALRMLENRPNKV